MAVKFVFRIDSERIRAEDPQTGYHTEVPNRAVIRERDGLLVGLSERKAPGSPGGQSPEERTGHRVAMLFGTGDAELEHEIKVLENITCVLHGQSRSARAAAHFAAKLADRFDYLFEIPGYEGFPEERRRALEESIQAHLRLRRLVMNGRDVQIPTWKRELEIWVRRLLVRGVPAGAVAAGYLTLPHAVAASRWSTAGYLAAIILLSYYGGKVLWMLGVRGLVPRTYRLCMLQGAHHRVLPIDRWLARTLWEDTP